MIFARASAVKSSTVRHKLDLGPVVAVCWNCDGKSTLIARFLLDQVVARQANPGRLRWRLLKSRPCKTRSHAP